MVDTIAELEAYFKTDLPKELQLTPHEKITNLRECIETHLNYLKHNPKKKIFLPYYNRLISIKKLLDDKRNKAI